MNAYYNEIDPYAAQWLRNLIAAGHIAPGDVDERSIVDVRPGDLAGYGQCHFFAGIGGWSIALRLAEWSDDRPVWTGSCPCQPFSAAGQGGGFDDERHLWPHWFHIVRECRPDTIFGEQVASKAGLAWFDLVHTDLESEDYAVAAADLCAAGIGAPHIRQRLWFVADARRGFDERCRRSGEAPSAAGSAQGEAQQRKRRGASSWPSGAFSFMAHADGRNTGAEGLQRSGEQRLITANCSAGDLADASRGGFGELWDAAQPGCGGYSNSGFVAGSMVNAASKQERVPRCPREPGNSPWEAVDWLACTDGKARPVEPGSFPLAHGVQRRTSKLRAYGNAIVPQVAAEFIRAAGDWS